MKRTILTPLYDRILVAREEVKETVGKLGIIIAPEQAKDKLREELSEGTVQAIGTGKMLEDGRVIPLAVKVGQRVKFGKYSGTDIVHEGQKLMLIREDEIFGVVTEYDDGVPEVVDPPQDELGAPTE